MLTIGVKNNDKKDIMISWQKIEKQNCFISNITEIFLQKEIFTFDNINNASKLLKNSYSLLNCIILFDLF